MDSDLPQQACIRYLGYIGVNKSMRALSQDLRAQVAKESINRLCEAKGITDRKTDRLHTAYVDRMLGTPTLNNSNSEVELIASSSHLKVICKTTKQIIVQHEMPNVSFACIGEQDTSDYVAYVAKNAEFDRACFVLECKQMATNILQYIARGFDLRRQQLSHGDGPLFNERFLNQPMDSYTSKLFNLPDVVSPSYNPDNIDNEDIDNLIATTRSLLEKEPWFHGTVLTREDSESKLKRDGDFLVRESIVDPGQFVISVMDNGTKLHLLIDSVGKVKTKDMVFEDVTDFVKFHHEREIPIKRENRAVFLRNGVTPALRT